MRRAMGRALGMLVLVGGVAACAIDPVPTPGTGDAFDNVKGEGTVGLVDASAPSGADATMGGCTCLDDRGQQWNCDPEAADACPCEPSTWVCPEGTEACEGAELPDVVEPAEVIEP